MAHRVASRLGVKGATETRCHAYGAAARCSPSRVNEKAPRHRRRVAVWPAVEVWRRLQKLAHQPHLGLKAVALALEFAEPIQLAVETRRQVEVPRHVE